MTMMHDLVAAADTATVHIAVVAVVVVVTVL